jgi:hypothetical protein
MVKSNILANAHSKNKMLFFCVCTRNSSDARVYKMPLWPAQVYWLGLGSTGFNVQGQPPDTRCLLQDLKSHKCSGILCPLTVADIFDKPAVSIFSHLLINTASYRRVQPSWWYLFFSVSPRKLRQYFQKFQAPSAKCSMLWWWSDIVRFEVLIAVLLKTSGMLNYRWLSSSQKSEGSKCLNLQHLQDPEDEGILTLRNIHNHFHKVTM